MGGTLWLWPSKSSTTFGFNYEKNEGKKNGDNDKVYRNKRNDNGNDIGNKNKGNENGKGKI